MRFTWDPAKAKRNQKRHGISFETASEVFDDPNQVVAANYFMEDAGEQRFQIIGMSRQLVLILAVFVEPETGLIRLISARKAVDYEESIYSDQFR